MSQQPALKPYQAPLFYVLLFVLWCGILLWLRFENQEHRRQEKMRLRGQAQVIIDTVASSIRSQSRMAMYHPERLQSILNEVINPESIFAIALLTQKGEIVAEAGNRSRIRYAFSLDSSLPEIWTKNSLQLWSVVQIGKVPWKHKKSREKRHHSKTLPREFLEKLQKRKPRLLLDKPFVLTIVISTASIRNTTSSATELRFVIAILSLFFLSIVGYLWQDSLRSVKLKTSLEVEKRKNQHLYEMNLAANGLAHETKNPLNSLYLTAQTLAEKHPELREKIDIIANEVDRLNSRINEWLAFSKQPSPKLTSVFLPQLFCELANLISIDLEEKNIELIFSPLEIKIQADWEMLRQLLFNLLLNSTQMIEENGRIEILVTQKNSQVNITLEDNGPGISPANKEKLFTPYFTTREEGSGLGLAICRQIALAHNWHIQYQDKTSPGARFILEGIILSNE